MWSEYISLDGIVEKPGQWSASDALLLGRITYEGFAAAWPTMEDVEGAFAVRMNTLPKYVASTTLARAEWNNSTIIRDNVPEEVSKLKREPGDDILIGGSGALAETLLQHKLVDEVRMLVHPIAVGVGKRLFEHRSEPIPMTLAGTRPMTLAGTRSFDSGVVALTYHPVD